jgi:hypothetical protein
MANLHRPAGESNHVPPTPGPQAHNHIAATALEQLRRAWRPRPFSPKLVGRVIETIRIHREQFEDILIELLTFPLSVLIEDILDERRKGGRPRG